MSEPTIGGLTADELIAKATESAYFLHLGKAPTEYELKLMQAGAAAGALSMYRELVALGKDLLDAEPEDKAPKPKCSCRYLNQGLPDAVHARDPNCPVHRKRPA